MICFNFLNREICKRIRKWHSYRCDDRRKLFIVIPYCFNFFINRHVIYDILFNIFKNVKKNEQIKFCKIFGQIT